MTIEEIRRKTAPIFKRYGVTRAAVFGSVARGSATKHSDIDLLVKFKTPPGLVGYIQMEEILTRSLGRKVDLVSAGGISPQLKPYISKDLITLYENR